MSRVKRLPDPADSLSRLERLRSDVTRFQSKTPEVKGYIEALDVAIAVLGGDPSRVMYETYRLPDYEAAVEALERLVDAIGTQRRYTFQVEAARAALRRLREGVPA